MDWRGRMELGIDSTGSGGRGDWHLQAGAIQQLLVGALSPAEANRAKRHLDDCEHCRSGWRALQAEKDRLLAEVRVRAHRAALVKAYEERRKQGDGVGRWLPAIAAAAAIAFAIGGGLSRGAFGTGPTPPTIEVKRTAAGQRTASIKGGSARYLLLYTRAPGGPWTLNWPTEGEASAPLARRGRTTPDLPEGAVEVLGLFSQQPVGRAAADQALARDKELAGTWQVRLTLDAR